MSIVDCSQRLFLHPNLLTQQSPVQELLISIDYDMSREWGRMGQNKTSHIVLQERQM